MKEIKILANVVKKPIDSANSLPPELITSGDFLSLELEHIFEKYWICVGTVNELSEPGDYITSNIAGRPIVTIKSVDGKIKSFSNVCLHRMMQLLHGRGNSKRIICPYHAWSYDINGQLIKAPKMEEHAEFNSNCFSLPELKTAVWQNWIYVTLNEDSPVITESLSKLSEIFDIYRLDNYVQIDHQDNEWNTNWKCLAENFMESYHLPMAHRGTIGPYSPIEKFDHFPGTEFFNYHLIHKNADAPAGVAQSANDYMPDKWRNVTVLACIYPSHFIALAPDYYWYLSLQPNGVGKVRIRYGLSVPQHVLDAQPNKEKYITDMIDLFDRVNEEDRFVVEGIFKGAQSKLATNGPLNNPLESPNYEFYQFLYRAITCYGGGVSGWFCS